MIDVERSQPAPASLARRVDGCWRAKEVRGRLRTDFLGKCYLCEVPLDGFEVDHRVPKGAEGSVSWEAHAFDWDDLFPACHDCNNGRPEPRPGGLLSPGDGVEARLAQAYLDDEPVFEAVDRADAAAANLAHELSHLHGRPNPAAADLRDNIRRTISKVLELQNDVYEAMLRDPKDAQEIARLKGRLRVAVSRGAAFTMLVRSKVKPRFHELFD